MSNVNVIIKINRRNLDPNANRVAAYLPTNYQVLDDLTTDDELFVGGFDNAGWTAEDYVLPRLASGMMFGEIVFLPKEQ